ncbi:MAG: Spy/CpxP family protein refolding chaperone [Beijerinckiaceae bacterium]
MTDQDMKPEGTGQPATTPAATTTAPAKKSFFRSRWFFGIAIVATGLVSYGLGKVSNHNRWSHHHSMARMAEDGRMTRGADFMLNRVLGRVDATQEQKDRIAEITRMTMRELAPLRDQHFATRAKLAELMKAQTVDRAAVEQLRAQEIALAETLSKRASQAFLDAADVLTPAQRTKLVERLQNRRGGGWYNKG